MSSGRIEMALIGHDSSDESWTYFRLLQQRYCWSVSCLPRFCFSTISLALFFGLSHFKNFSIFIVTGTALIGANQIFNYLCIVERKFREIAISRVVQICSLVVLSISFGKIWFWCRSTFDRTLDGFVIKCLLSILF